MITKVVAVSPRGATLEFPFEDVSTGFLLQEIEGLDPVVAQMASTQFAQMDGEEYQSSSLDKRNIVMSVGIVPDLRVASVQEKRKELYRFFMPKAPVTLRFYDDDVYVAEISGRVESCGAPLFSKEPEAKISILCFDPDFLAPEQVEFSGVTGAFSYSEEIDYEGTVDTGFFFRLEVSRTISSFQIVNDVGTGSSQQMNFAAPLLAGDSVRITTRPGEKSAFLNRGGLVSPILYGVSAASAWPWLEPGINTFRVVVSGDPMPFFLYYLPRFGGL